MDKCENKNNIIFKGEKIQNLQCTIQKKFTIQRKPIDALQQTNQILIRNIAFSNLNLNFLKNLQHQNFC